MAYSIKPAGPPGVRFVYSDINFILLGELVHRLSGQMVSEYARDNIFLPLGMKETMFLPPAALVPRIAPTERMSHGRGASARRGARPHRPLHGRRGRPRRPVLHRRRPGALRADDAQRRRTGRRARVQPAHRREIHRAAEPARSADAARPRLGYRFALSGNRGELFPIGSYGHTGFTGTSIWIDPASKTYVILLANSVHPDLRPAITALRGKVATIAAAAVGITEPGITLTGYNETLVGPGLRREVARNGQVKTGLDVLEDQKFQALPGQAHRADHQPDRHRPPGPPQYRSDDAGGRQRGRAVFARARHRGRGRPARNRATPWTPRPASRSSASTRSQTSRPTPEMLRGFDALVFDIQDVGARFYTYETTMAYAMEAAAKAGIPFYVLDRPNPITGVHVEGPLLDRRQALVRRLFSAAACATA